MLTTCCSINLRTTLLVAVQEVVDQVVDLHGVVQAYLADAGADRHVGTHPKFVRGAHEIRLQRFRPCDEREKDSQEVETVGTIEGDRLDRDKNIVSRCVERLLRVKIFQDFLCPGVCNAFVERISSRYEQNISHG